ncbi:MAG: exo-alpha-sialidase [Polyangiaceae bacterium]|nr:exo-alpha-sialidase [Polyangiaceae bacterium]
MDPVARWPRRLAGLFVGLSPVGACAGAGAPAPGSPPTPAAPASSSAPGGSMAPAASAPPGAVGAACAAERPFQRGSCAAGLLCSPAPGGYCTAWCGFGSRCGGGAICAASHRAGELCVAGCGSDADCRDGYACDPTWRACAPPGFLAPEPPRCAAGPAPAGAPRARAAFEAPRLVSVGPSRGRYSFEPTAALLPDGGLAVVYTAMNEQDADNALAAIVVRADGSLSPTIVIRSGKRRHFDPWLAARGGELALVWLGHDGGGRDLNAEVALATSRDGLAWTAPRAVHDARRDCADGAPYCLDKPMVAAVLRAGRARADWLVTYAGTDGLRAVASDAASPGEPFSAAAEAGDGSYGDLRVDAAGRVHLAVVAGPRGERTHPFGDARSEVRYSSSADGGRTFSAPVRVNGAEEPVPFYFSNAQVVADPSRRAVHVAYPAGGPDLRWRIVVATTRDGGQTWSRRYAEDDPPCAHHMTPRLELDPRTGDLHLLWAENRGGSGRMVYTRCPGAGGACDPNEALSDVPFAAYGVVRHASWWRGEYDVLLLDPQRRVLHAVWTQPVDEAGVPTSRVFYSRSRLRAGP